MIPLGVAAGHLKYAAQVQPLLRIDSSILKYITLGSYTPEARPGNSGTVFWNDGCNNPTALNALGLPNPGIDGRVDMLELGDQLRHTNHIGRISIAGQGVEDYEQLALTLRHLSSHNIAELELNLGCPNVRDSGQQHPIFSFKPELINEITRRVGKAYDCVGPRIAVKLSPYSDPILLKEVAAVIRDSRYVQTVVTCNTFPNGLAFGHDGKPAIGANKGFAGLSGSAMKHIALGQVAQFREELPTEVSVVGVGGITNADDVRDMELAGASWVQIGTAFFLHNDPHVFQRIAEEYAESFA